MKSGIYFPPLLLLIAVLCNLIPTSRTSNALTLISDSTPMLFPGLPKESEPFSRDVYIKMNSPPAHVFGVLCQCEDYIRVQIDPVQNLIYFVYRDVLGNTYPYNTAGVLNSNWMNIFLTFDGNQQFVLYQNGSKIGIFLARHLDYKRECHSMQLLNHFGAPTSKGKILFRNLRTWKGKLSESEVAAAVTNSIISSSLENKLVNWYNLDEVVDGSLKDSGVNRMHVYNKAYETSTGATFGNSCDFPVTLYDYWTPQAFLSPNLPSTDFDISALPQLSAYIAGFWFMVQDEAQTGDLVKGEGNTCLFNSVIKLNSANLYVTTYYEGTEIATSPIITSFSYAKRWYYFTVTKSHNSLPQFKVYESNFVLKGSAVTAEYAENDFIFCQKIKFMAAPSKPIFKQFALYYNPTITVTEMNYYLERGHHHVDLMIYWPMTTRPGRPLKNEIPNGISTPCSPSSSTTSTTWVDGGNSVEPNLLHVCPHGYHYTPSGSINTQCKFSRKEYYYDSSQTYPVGTTYNTQSISGAVVSMKSVESTVLLWYRRASVAGGFSWHARLDRSALNSKYWQLTHNSASCTFNINYNDNSAGSTVTVSPTYTEEDWKFMGVGIKQFPGYVSFLFDNIYTASFKLTKTSKIHTDAVFYSTITGGEMRYAQLGIFQRYMNLNEIKSRMYSGMSGSEVGLLYYQSPSTENIHYEDNTQAPVPFCPYGEYIIHASFCSLPPLLAIREIYLNIAYFAFTNEGAMEIMFTGGITSAVLMQLPGTFIVTLVGGKVKVILYSDTGGVKASYTSSTSVSSGNNHVIVSFYATTILIYVNGVKNIGAMSNSNNMAQYSYQVKVAASGGYIRLRELRIWNRPIYKNEVPDLYFASVTPALYSSLRMYYTMTPPGTELLDLSHTHELGGEKNLVTKLQNYDYFWDFSTQMKICPAHYKYDSANKQCYFSESALNANKDPGSTGAPRTYSSRLSLLGLDSVTEYTLEFWSFVPSGAHTILLDCERFSGTEKSFTPKLPGQTTLTFGSPGSTYNQWCYLGFGLKSNSDTYFIYKIGCDKQYISGATNAGALSASSSPYMKITTGSGTAGSMINKVSFWNKKNDQTMVRYHAWKWNIEGGATHNAQELLVYYPLLRNFEETTGHVSNLVESTDTVHYFSLAPRAFQRVYESMDWDTSNYLPLWPLADMTVSTYSQIRSIQILETKLLITMDAAVTLNGLSSPFPCSSFVHPSSISKFGVTPICTFANNLISLAISNTHTLTSGTQLKFQDALILPNLIFSDLRYYVSKPPLYYTTKFGTSTTVARHETTILEAILVNSNGGAVSTVWSQVSGPSITLDPSNTKQTFLPYALPSGSIVLRMKVSLDGDTALYDQTNDFSLKVISKPRVGLVYKSYTSHIGGSLVLNGSRSVDGDTNIFSEELTCLWECFEDISLLTYCSSSNLPLSGVDVSNYTLSLPSQSLVTLGVYYFKFSLTKDNLASDYDTVRVTVKESGSQYIPLSIETFSTLSQRKVSADLSNRFKVVFNGTTVNETYNITWSIEPSTITLISEEKYVSIPVGSLQRGSTYILRCRVETESRSGEIEYAFNTSRGVGNGSVNIGHTGTGEGYTDIFTMTPHPGDWVDREGGRLRYKFAYRMLGEERVIAFSDWLLVDNYATKVRPGRKADNHLLEIYVYGQNDYGDIACTVNLLTVNAPSDPSTTVVNREIDAIKGLNDSAVQAKVLADLTYYLEKDEDIIVSATDLCGGCVISHGVCNNSTKLCECTTGYTGAWDCSLSDEDATNTRTISLQLLNEVKSMQENAEIGYSGTLPESILQVLHQVNINSGAQNDTVMDTSDECYRNFIDRVFNITRTDLESGDDFEYSQRVKLSVDSKEKVFDILSNHHKYVKQSWRKGGEGVNGELDAKTKQEVEILEKVAVVALADYEIGVGEMNIDTQEFKGVGGKRTNEELKGSTFESKGSFLTLPQGDLGGGGGDQLSNYLFLVWEGNPHLGHSEMDELSGNALQFLSFAQYNTTIHHSTNLTSLPTIMFLLKNRTDVKSCLYFNELTGLYSSEGINLTEIKTVEGGTQITCTTTHFSTFTSSTREPSILANSTTTTTITDTKKDEDDEYNGFWYNLYNFGALSDYEFYSFVTFWLSLCFTIIMIIFAWISYTQETGVEKLKKLQVLAYPHLQRRSDPSITPDGPPVDSDEDIAHLVDLQNATGITCANYCRFFMSAHSVLRNFQFQENNALKRSCRILLLNSEGLLLMLFSGLFYDSETGEGINGDVSFFGKITIALFGIFITAPLLWIKIRLFAKREPLPSLGINELSEFRETQTKKRWIGLLIYLAEVLICLIYINILTGSFSDDAYWEWIITWFIALSLDYFILQPVKITFLFCCSQEKTLNGLYVLLTGASTSA